MKNSKAACGAVLLVVATASPRWSAIDFVRAEQPAERSAGMAPAIEKPGLHNVRSITPRLFSGAEPAGAEAFASLQEMGVKTIVSVDGARPDVAAARKHSIRYVHLPIGYDGISRQRALEIAKAVRDLPGPFYLHCHHGKHRGPAAAAVARYALDPTCQRADALEILRSCGTDPRYEGLYKTLETLVRPTSAELDALPTAFPEIAQVPPLAEQMVSLDAAWEAVRRRRADAWRTPKKGETSPSVLLLEQFQELQRLDDVAARPEDFRRSLESSRKAAELLTAEFADARGGRQPNLEKAEAAFRAVGAGCVQCHQRHRDRRPAP